MTVIWLPRAKAELRRQAKWLEENRGHRAVLTYFEQVHDAVERLRRGELVLYRLYDAARNIRYLPVNEQTNLYYRPSADFIELLTFFNTRQDPDKLKL